MTNENIIKQLKRLIPSLQYADDVNAVKGAIQALSQEPTDENLHREREQAYMQGYEDASKRFRQEPCEDAISREAVLDEIEKWIVIELQYTNATPRLIKRINELPSVTPSRHVNCETAEQDGNGCLGYSHYGDDFPIEECLHCPKYTSYEKE